MGKTDAAQGNNSQMELESKIESLANVDLPLYPQNPVSILVIDDDQLCFECIETILYSFNYNIIHAKNGQEAVNIFQSNKDISLIFMDLQMPVMDGFTATEEIRKINTEVPIICQTSYSISGIKKKAINSGCTDFLLKLLIPEVLINKIENYLKLTEKNQLALS